jgi:hypothetical protein
MMSGCDAPWVDPGDCGERPARLDRYQQAELAYREADAERVRSSGELWRTEVPRVVERLPWMSLEGCQFLPRCASCESPLTFRGVWECDACRRRHPMGADYVGIEVPRSLPVQAIAGLTPESSASWGPEDPRIFRPAEGHNSSPAQNRLAAMEALTGPYRDGRRASLLAAGARPVVGGTAMSAWHEARARGVGERFVRVPTCGRLLGVAEEDGTGRVVLVEYRCGDWRVCHRCLGRRKRKLRQLSEQVRSRALAALRPEMGRYYGGAEGRWSEKLLTLTVPHSGDIRVDAARGTRAWALYEQRFRHHFREQRGLGKDRGNIPWIAGIEAARGVHWHKHQWLLSPFVEVALLRVWWGRALIEAGVPNELMPHHRWGDVCSGVRDEERVRGWLGVSADDVVPWPVVDLRGGTLADYATKVGLADYVVKSDGVPMELHPALRAVAYEALDGARIVQCARGWRAQDGRQSVWRLRRATAAEHAAWGGAPSGYPNQSLRKRAVGGPRSRRTRPQVRVSAWSMALRCAPRAPRKSPSARGTGPK